LVFVNKKEQFSVLVEKQLRLFDEETKRIIFLAPHIQAKAQEAFLGAHV